MFSGIDIHGEGRPRCKSDRMPWLLCPRAMMKKTINVPVGELYEMMLMVRFSSFWTREDPEQPVWGGADCLSLVGQCQSHRQPGWVMLGSLKPADSEAFTGDDGRRAEQDSAKVHLLGTWYLQFTYCNLIYCMYCALMYFLCVVNRAAVHNN